MNNLSKISQTAQLESCAVCDSAYQMIEFYVNQNNWYSNRQ